jgi:hypothetical protein
MCLARNGCRSRPWLEPDKLMLGLSFEHAGEARSKVDSMRCVMSIAGRKVLQSLADSPVDNNRAATFLAHFANKRSLKLLSSLDAASREKQVTGLAHQRDASSIIANDGIDRWPRPVDPLVVTLAKYWNH